MDSETTLDLVHNDEHRVIYKIRKTGFPIAVVSCIVLLVVCIVLAVLYSRAVTPSPTSPSGQKPKKYETCDDERCFHLALEVVKKMNKSVDPCQDFYAYACGGWEKRTPFGSASEVTVMSLVAEENTKVIKNALEQAHLNYSQNSAIMKTVRFYDSCMNTTAIDSYGLQPLKDLIKEYGGWSVSSNYDPKVTLQIRVVRFIRELNVNNLFAINPTINPYNSSEMIIQVTLGPLPRNEVAQPLNSGSTANLVNTAYLNYMQAVGRMLSGSNSSDARMTAIFEFEMRIYQMVGGANRNVEMLHYILGNSDKDLRMTLPEFCNSSGFSLPFMREIISGVFGVNLKDSDKILPGPMQGFKNLYRLFKQTNQAVIADYIMWQAVNKYIDGVADGYLSPKLAFLSLLTGTPPRWKRCINKMMGPFDMSLGLLYVDAHFKEESKKTIEEMFGNIRTSFIDNLKDQTWMDSKTRNLAKEKALAATVDIGYPMFIKNNKKLEAHYHLLNMSDSLFENIKSFNYFSKKRRVELYLKPVDRNMWFYESPAQYNGFYSPCFNRIVFLAGILQSPNYSPQFPRYMNYGGIGMVIGHEVTHGFDGIGRKYDKHGNVKNWWSGSADAGFRQKAKCFVKQYDSYKFYDTPVNGTQTLDENISDNGGIKFAYDAYKALERKNGTEKILPGLDFSPDQLFFLAFAQSWCSKYTKIGATNLMRTDTHSLNKYRVIGSLSNFKKFSEVFKCPANSPMNPSAKCAIW